MQWQPIETAPKDGTIFLVWNETHNGGYVDFCVWAESLCRWQEPDAEVSGAMTPTHWMPLPEAPNAMPVGAQCKRCNGSGEVFVGQQFPDDEGFTTCLACDGDGILPTIDDICELRKQKNELMGCCEAMEWELNFWKQNGHAP